MLQPFSPGLPEPTHRHHSCSSTTQDGLQVTLVLRGRACHLPCSSVPHGLFPLTLELFLHLASDTEIQKALAGAAGGCGKDPATFPWMYGVHKQREG